MLRQHRDFSKGGQRGGILYVSEATMCVGGSER